MSQSTQQFLDSTCFSCCKIFFGLICCRYKQFSTVRLIQQQQSICQEEPTGHLKHWKTLEFKGTKNLVGMKALSQPLLASKPPGLFRVLCAYRCQPHEILGHLLLVQKHLSLNQWCVGRNLESVSTYHHHQLVTKDAKQFQQCVLETWPPILREKRRQIPPWCKLLVENYISGSFRHLPKPSSSQGFLGNQRA